MGVGSGLGEKGPGTGGRRVLYRRSVGGRGVREKKVLKSDKNIVLWNSFVNRVEKREVKKGVGVSNWYGEIAQRFGATQGVTVTFRTRSEKDGM